MEEPPPPSDLINFAEELKNYNYFGDQIRKMLEPIENILLVQLGGKSRKRFGSKKKQTRRLYGGAAVTKVEITTYATIIVIIAALGVQTNSLAFFGRMVEWMQENPKFFYENIMKSLISIVMKQVYERPTQLAFEKICVGLKSVPDAVNALWSVYTKSVSIKTGQENLSPQNVTILKKSIKTMMKSVDVIKFQVPCGSITFHMDNNVNCTKIT